MPLTLCLPPSAGEPREVVKCVLNEQRTVLAVPARHLIDRIGIDPEDGSSVAVWIDGASERARPVHVRFELVSVDTPAPFSGQLLGRVGDHDVYGAYLGPVSEEN
jgi:hypothetical protein